MAMWILVAALAVCAGCDQAFGLDTGAAHSTHRAELSRSEGLRWSRRLQQQQALPGTGAAASTAAAAGSSASNTASVPSGANTTVNATAPAAPTCEVGPWNLSSACVRTGINQWSQTRSRQVAKQGARCPSLEETVDCEPQRQPKPADAAGALQQTTLAMVTALPLAITTALDNQASNQAPGIGDPNQKQVSPPEIAAGRALWSQQASSYDKLTCLPFNGPHNLLTHATANAATPAVKQMLARATSSAQAAVTAARTAAGLDGLHASPGAGRSSIAQAGGTLAAVAWDGDVTLGAKFFIDGVMTETEALMAENVMADTVYSMMSWMHVEGQLPSASVMNLSVAYDSSQQAVTFSSNSCNSLALLSAIERPLHYTFGVDPPSSPESFAATAPVASVASLKVSPTQGVQELAIGLSGDWSPSALSLQLGLPWVLPDDMFSIAPEPLLLYNAVPSVMYVAMTVDVPALGVAGMTSTLNIQAGQQLSLQLYGPTFPIPHLSITNDLVLTSLPNGGFVTKADGILADLSVLIAATITRSKGTFFTMTTTKQTVSVNNLVQTMYTPSQVPEFLMNFIQPLGFSRVTVTYTSSTNTTRNTTISSEPTASEAPGTFALLAVPDIDGAPKLKQILNAVGLGVTDIVLKSTGEAAMTLGLQQPFKLQLPEPLTNAGPTLLALQQDSSSMAVVLSGSLTASILLPGVTSPVGLQLHAGISTGAGDAVTAHFTGSALIASFAFESFKFVQFGAMQLAAAVSYEPLQLNQLTLHGPVTVFGVAAPATFSFDKASNSLVYLAELPQLDLQLMLQAMGVKLKLGNLNVQLTRVRQSYAAVAAPAMDVEAGMQFVGELSFLGMQSNVKFELTGEGVGFVAVFNSTQFSQAFKSLVTSRVAGVLKGAAAAVQAASISTQNSQGGLGPSQLNNFMADLLAAQQQLSVASSQYEAAKNKAVGDLLSAQSKATFASTAFEAARKQRGQVLDNAASKYRAADAALMAAEVDAFSDLDAAKDSLTEAQSDFSNAVADALVSVEVAQIAANELKITYNTNNSQCDAYPWTQTNCAAAAAGWTAYQAAADQLVSATDALAVAATATAVKLAFARASLAESQNAANAVSSGSQRASRDAALLAFNTAKAAAVAVASSSEASLLATANNNLTAAQAVNAVLSGSAAWQALNAATAQLDVASAQMYSAEAAATATADARAAAAAALKQALLQVQGENFLQLASFIVNFTLQKDVIMLYASYDVIVSGGQRLMGRFAIDVNSSPQELKLMLVGVLKNEAMMSLKSSYNGMAQFVA